MTLTIPPRDIAALERIAAKGYRVIVEGNGLRRVVEPCPPGDDVEGSGGEDASAKEPGRWR